MEIVGYTVGDTQRSRLNQLLKRNIGAVILVPAFPDKPIRIATRADIAPVDPDHLKGTDWMSTTTGEILDMSDCFTTEREIHGQVVVHFNLDKRTGYDYTITRKALLPRHKPLQADGDALEDRKEDMKFTTTI